MFAMAKIIKAANVKEDLVDIISKAQTGEISSEKVGIEGVMCIINACGDDKVEQKVYDLLDDVFEAKTEDMSIEVLLQNLKQLAKENNIMSFFRSAGALTEK